MPKDDIIPILLDTDIGSDIDDAVCLAYLLRQPRCELVGVTTVSGQVEERAKLVSAMCLAAGRTDVPIHPGTENPMLTPQKQPEAPQSAALASLPHSTDFKSNSAIDFMRQTIHERPGEITLLAIGPMTNIGLLFAIDPEIPSLLKQLVLMCGNFPDGQEWNAITDPYATAIVYKAQPKLHISVSIDVTTRCFLDANLCRQKFVGSVLEAAAKMAETWFKHVDGITFHDPLTAAIIFEPDICKYENGSVEVEIMDKENMGTTRWNADSTDKRHTIAVDVDPDRFFEHYFSIAGL